MTAVTVTTQHELDQALADREEVIYIESPAGLWLTINQTGSSRVVAWGSSSVEAWGSSSVEARDSSSVEAWGSSSVVARDSSRVEAWGSSSVEARDSSSVVAWDSSRVEARESSRVEAWGSSSVVARESSSVEARDSSSVEASKYVAVHVWSPAVTLTGDGHVIDMTAVDVSDPYQWCEFHGVTVTDGVTYLYKAVDDDWTTAYGTSYAPGSTPQAPDWNTRPKCGGGLHLCASPSGSKWYKPNATRFVKCGVRLDEMVCLGDKVKVKRVVVPCVEVDIHGDEIEAST